MKPKSPFVCGASRSRLPNPINPPGFLSRFPRVASLQVDRSWARPGGFVLVTVLLIIALVTILVVAGSMLAQVERRVTSTFSKTELARQNALLALDLAVGQLQASAGPDQRITARGDILSNNANNPYWTGVWMTGTSGLDVAATGTPQHTQSLGGASEELPFELRFRPSRRGGVGICSQFPGIHRWRGG